MKVILFGATGMIGQGTLRECLLAPDVDAVLSIVRSPTGQQHPKLRELAHADFTDFEPIAPQLAGYDACFFCLGISSSGLSEAEYTRVTHDFPLAAARTLLRQSPGLTFIYVSGAGADSSEGSRTMWARVKGKAENALARLPFKAVYSVRPAMVRAMHGATSRTPLYRALYVVLGPLFPLIRALFPRHVTTTENIGRAMLQAVRHGAPQPVLECHDINALAVAAAPPAG